jgi:hypothetical protein
MNKTFRFLCFVLGLTLWLTGGFPIGVGQAQTENPQSVCLRSVDASNFPTIALEARVEGFHHHTWTGLDASSLRVQENNVEYPITEVQWLPNRNGIKLAIIVDVGRPTNQAMVKQILLDFAVNYMLDGEDQISLYISDPAEKDSRNYLVLNTTSRQALINKVNSLNDSNLTKPASYTDPLNRLFLYVFNELKQKASQNNCEKFSAVWAFSAPDNVVPAHKRDAFVNAMMEAKTPIYLIQISTPGTLYASQEEDRQIAEKSGGELFNISSDAKDDSVLKPLFSQLEQERGIYILKYQTKQANNGDHLVELLVPGQMDAPTLATKTYVMNLQPPVIEMVSPISGARLERTAIVQPDQPLSFDQETLVVEFNISWPDGYTRAIKSTRLELTTPTGSNTISTAATLANNLYQFNWKIDVNDAGETPITLQVKVVDEFDQEWASNSVGMTIVNNIIIQQPPVEITRSWMFYALLGVVGLVIVLFVVLGWALLMLRKQIPGLLKEGGVGRLASEVRKTIIGGGRRKVLAEFIVRQGPVNLINQHLKVSTESVRLGRDPRKADFTFFEDANSSVSGLHCRVERFGGSWRVVAVSESGNETFIDGTPIPFNQPVPIQSGQVIRMGYPAQQPVELEFVIMESAPSEVDDPRKTDVLRDPDAKKTEVEPLKPGGLGFGPGPMVVPGGKTNEAGNDADFDEFRDPERR